MDLLLNNKEGIFYAAIGFLLFGWLLNKGASFLINRLISVVDAMYAAGDEADDRLLTAFMRWINEKFGPKVDGDQVWPERMNAAVLRFVMWIPFLPVRLFFQAYADRIKELCYKLYSLGIEATKRQLAKHDPPTP